MFIGFLCVFVGLPTIRHDNYFLSDDFGLVQHLHDLPLQRLLSYFVSDWTEGAYGAQLDELRPVLAFSYWLDAHLYGAINVAGYHATNVILHMLNALLVLAIARTIAPGETAFPLLSASLFAVMPSHSEPIAWISGRVDSLAALTYLGAFLCFVRYRNVQHTRWLLASLLAFVCGLFTKQSLITFPVLIVAYDLFQSTVKSSRTVTVPRVAAHVPFLVVLSLYLALRYELFGNAVREDALGVSMLVEFVSLRQWFYVMNWLPTFSIVATAATIAALTLCALWMWEQRKRYRTATARVVFFGVIWYVVTVAPMVVTYPSARHLYLTSAGLAIALASVVFPGAIASERQRRPARLTMAALLIFVGATALMLSSQRWVRSGIESGHAVAAMPRLLADVPPGSVVVIGLPSKREDVALWAYALPFALQPPFLAENLYDRFRFIEDPRVYCCRDRWWSAKEGTFASVMGSDSMPVNLIEPSVDDKGTPRRTTRTFKGAEIRQKLEESIGMPVENFSKMTRLQAQTIVPILMK